MSIEDLSFPSQNSVNSSNGHGSSMSKRFIHGPIPIIWIKRTKELGADALLVGLALHHFSGMNKKRNRYVFKAGFEDLTLNCSSIRSVMRGVHKLEKANLVKITRNPGQKNVYNVDNIIFRLSERNTPSNTTSMRS